MIYELTVINSNSDEELRILISFGNHKLHHLKKKRINNKKNISNDRTCEFYDVHYQREKT